LQSESEPRRRLEAPGGIDFKAAQNDLLQERWNVLADFARRNRIAPEARFQSLLRTRRAEGPLAGRQMIEQHAQRENI
jgi:hypothetical protein